MNSRTHTRRGVQPSEIGLYTSFLFTRRQRAVCGCLHTHMATVREREKLVKSVSHRLRADNEPCASFDMKWEECGYGIFSS